MGATAEDLIDKGTADFVIRGEAEDGLVMLAKALDNGGGLKDVPNLTWHDSSEVRTNPLGAPPDLDALPFPDWSMFQLSSYQAPPLFRFKKTLLPVHASRGCPYRCVFCSQNVMTPKVRQRDLQSVVQEIERNLLDFGIDLFWFSDAIFPLTPSQGHRFSDLMISKGLHKRTRWITECRVDSVDEPLLRHMKKAGLFMVIYGFEVGNGQLLARIKPGATIEDAKLAMRATRNVELHSLGLFMLGFPGESVQSCRETIQFALELGVLVKQTHQEFLTQKVTRDSQTLLRLSCYEYPTLTSQRFETSSRSSIVLAHQT